MNIFQIIVSRISKEIADSKNPTNKTQRTGEYRIGLRRAQDIIQDFEHEMFKEQIINAFNAGMNQSVDYFEPETGLSEAENYYNKTPFIIVK